VVLLGSDAISKFDGGAVLLAAVHQESDQLICVKRESVEALPHEALERLNLACRLAGRSGISRSSKAERVCARYRPRRLWMISLIFAWSMLRHLLRALGPPS
jgi:hypothetical protein